MSEKGKVWVIGPTNKKSQRHSGRAIQKEFGQSATQQTDAQRRQPASQAGHTASQARDNRTYASRSGTGAREQLYRNSSYRKDTAPLLLLAYLLGPFAIFVTREGRKSKFWLSAAIGSGIATAILLTMWRSISAWLEAGSASNLLLIVLTSFVVLAAVTTWVRAVLLIGRYSNIIVPNLPSWIRQSWMTGTLGLIVPGLGLFIAGRVKRAAIALWVVGTALLSIFILSNASLLWDGNQGSGSAVIASRTLEYMLLALGAISLIGALTWIVQALDGARLAGNRSNQNNRVQGNVIAIALLVAIIIFSVMSEPATIAKTLDRFAVSKHLEGYQVIPLCMARTAIRLDPSQPEYVMRAAMFYEDLGEQQTARIMREELVERWEPCVSVAKQHNSRGRVGAHSSLRGNVGISSRMKKRIEEEWVSSWDRIMAFYGSLAIAAEDKESTDERSTDEQSTDE